MVARMIIIYFEAKRSAGRLTDDNIEYNERAAS